MRYARPKQTADCWVVALGHGDKFILDAGSGFAERISAAPFLFLPKEAIFRLAGEGFTTMVPRKGTYIRQASLKDLLSLRFKHTGESFISGDLRLVFPNE